jgi:2-keto-4-pentenoate hydratase/2-oxohepta-3-ene-1,7-dioic acid hydratase in catechol pathway
MIKFLSRTVEKTTMTLPWKRLNRFEAVDGRILRGEPVLPADKDVDLGLITEADQLQARILEGEDIYDTTGKTVLTEQTAQVKRVLSPLAQNDVPILRCVGLNYAKHSESSLIRKTQNNYKLTLLLVKEAGRKPPPFPFIFFKANTTVLDHGEPVVVPKIAQNDQADYEGELV